jgi:hypothetical protein
METYIYNFFQKYKASNPICGKRHRRIHTLGNKRPHPQQTIPITPQPHAPIHLTYLILILVLVLFLILSPRNSATQNSPS